MLKLLSTEGFLVCYDYPMLQTEYPEVDSLVNELSGGIKSVFGNELMGMYVFGSLVTGDFEPERSDVDILAIVKHDITPQQLDSLHGMHAQFVDQHPSWRERIEVDYVPIDGMRDFKTKASRIARIAPGDPLDFQTMDINWLMDWYMVLRYGQTVQGPPPEELIPAITQREFIASVEKRLPSWLAEVKEAHHIGYQSYIILSLCRSLYVLEFSEQVSKKQAGKWVAGQYPQWRGLIEKAMEWKGSPDRSKSPETRAQTEEFVKFVLTEADMKL